MVMRLGVFVGKAPSSMIMITESNASIMFGFSVFGALAAFDDQQADPLDERRIRLACQAANAIKPLGA
jgi:hypothetical protein